MPGKKKRNRPSWDDYFMKLSQVIGERGTCDRGYAGTVIVKDKRILATGYVGAPTGQPHCDEAGHELHTVINIDGSKSKHCIRTTHSEQNAIIQAARFGISINGSTLYTKMVPCYACAKMIVNAGIIRVVCGQKYHAGEISQKLFEKSGIKIDVLSDETVTYDDME